MKLPLLVTSILLGGFFWVKNSLTATTFLPVEVCDNAIDDDEDGLIDLNDPDCDCPVALPQSLIPNPSFEDRVCCPLDRSQLYCADTWIQASEPTTDYLHTCGWMGWPDLPPPLPFPDGDGCVGFRNGRIGNPNGPNGPEEANLNWKEYAGACLISPLLAGVEYRFEFWIGFTQAFNSPSTTISFYGTTDCENLPFGINNTKHGCPLNGEGWVELGSVPISGTLEWKLKEINVKPIQDIYAIAIGPNCIEQNNVADTYYFFDNLVLADVKQFELKITESGNPCGDDFKLSMPYRDSLSYQWYRDGIAIIGATSASLEGIEDAPGAYQVRLVGPNSCMTTLKYIYKKPQYRTTIDSVICKDESVFFHQANINVAGEYFDTLQSFRGCDSILQLRLKISAEGVDTVVAKIFEGETYMLGNQPFKKAGEFDAHFSSLYGCDSVVHLSLDFYKIFIPNALTPNGDGINDVFTIYSGDEVEEVLSLEVFDRWGGQVFSQFSLPPNDGTYGWDGTAHGKPASLGTYVWQASVRFDDGKKRVLSGSVTLLQ